MAVCAPIAPRPAFTPSSVNVAPHSLHALDRAWPETNCYVDLWIELLHGLGLDPTPMLAFTLGAGHEGDQWTFGKPWAGDLWALYGIDVQELTVWRSVVDHLDEQLALGRVVLVEVDAFYLPDTIGVSYRSAHTKTTIAVHALDRADRRLGYFHNAGRFTLEDDDFDGVLRTGGDHPSADLAPFTEVVKLGAMQAYDRDMLARLAEGLLRMHLRRAPARNPVEQYAARLTADIAGLGGVDAMEGFHRYAFATVRQCGASAELGAAFLRWLDADGGRALATPAAALDDLARGAKALQFALARAVATRRAVDPSPTLALMAARWEDAFGALRARYGD